MEHSYVGDLIPSINSYLKIIDQYERGLKKGEFYEEPIGEDPFGHIYPDWQFSEKQFLAMYFKLNNNKFVVILILFYVA